MYAEDYYSVKIRVVWYIVFGPWTVWNTPYGGWSSVTYGNGMFVIVDQTTGTNNVMTAEW